MPHLLAQNSLSQEVISLALKKFKKYLTRLILFRHQPKVSVFVELGIKNKNQTENYF